MQRARLEHETVDLGNEPPLSVDGASDPIDRRRISAQWFSGTILTGLSGAALMGGAVFASLDGETNFAALPDRVQNLMRGSIIGGDKIAGVRKGDRLPPAGEANGAKQVIRVTTMNRVGDREVVRVRPFVKVSANLAMTPSELTASIPAFNAQKMLAAAGSDDTPVEEPGAEPDAEVTFVMRELGNVLGRAKISAKVPPDEVLAKVRDTANWSAGAQARFQVAGVHPITTAALSYAPSDREPDPYAGFEALIVPENITLLPKTANQTTGGNAWNERAVTVRKGDSVASVLTEMGATPDEVQAIVAALGARGDENGLKEGQRLRILVSSVDGSQRHKPVRIIVTGETAIEAVVALSDSGKYVPVDVASMNDSGVAEAAGEEEEDDGKGMRLYHSLYETALRNQVPKPVIESLIRIYSYDVDFQGKAQPGDSFDLLYTGDDDGDGDGKADVMFASLTVGGEVKKFYRFQTPDDGLVDYYDETGKSAKQFLVRKPLAQGIMRSGFGSRRHPLLGYTKMHTGVDWAAPLGTPIYASGNGVVERVGWESGYGKYVRIRHANGYETAYGHMTAFARSTQAGARVRQGQVIGYVGSTGLSTGPHLHYEIMVNGRFVDPLRLRLPRGRVLNGRALAGFEQERDRVDAMIARYSRVAAAGQSSR